MLDINKKSAVISLLTMPAKTLLAVVLLALTLNVGYAQTITKSKPPSVQTPSTVGKIVKWTGVQNNGEGIIGDSVITESAGNIGVGVASPTAKLAVAGSITATGDINGAGTLSGNVVNATTQYNIGGARVLSVAGLNNTIVGVNANPANTGQGNAFFGTSAGANANDNFNSFFGAFSGQNNTTGGANSFVGYQSGGANMTGSANSFFGSLAGQSNTTANFNAFFGAAAGRDNSTGEFNSFFGSTAGTNNTTGHRNAFFGTSAGFSNTTAPNNSFFGYAAGSSNTTGNGNSVFGSAAGEENETGQNNSFFGYQAGLETTQSNNSFFGAFAGGVNTTGANNSFFGFSAGSFPNTTGTHLTMIGAGAEAGVDGLTYATAIGSDAIVSTSNTMVLGRPADTVHVPGTLTKSAGSFKIDYPLDPANKTLSHSFIESPDMMNIYNGNVTTNAKGEAMIALPEYFEALNRDFRYQLTVIGQFAQAIVLRKIRDNQFVIKTSKPGVEVSWQVTGIRHDAYANANRIPVVEDKGNQRGTYLHPQLLSSSSARVQGTTPR